MNTKCPRTIIAILVMLNCGSNKATSQPLFREIERELNSIQADFTQMRMINLRQVQSFEYAGNKFELMDLELEGAVQADGVSQKIRKIYISSKHKVIAKQENDASTPPEFHDVTGDGILDAVIWRRDLNPDDPVEHVEVYDVSQGTFRSIFSSDDSFSRDAEFIEYERKFHFRTKKIRISESLAFDDCLRTYLAEYHPQIHVPADHTGRSAFSFENGVFVPVIPVRKNNLREIRAVFEKIGARYSAEKAFQDWPCGC